MTSHLTPPAKTVLILDSGVGGLSITRAIANQLPELRLHYVADDAGFPYGAWDEQALIAHICQLLAEAARRHTADAIVIACNTASTSVLPALRAQFSIPIIGTVPAIKPAAAASISKLISVIATMGTIHRPYLADLIKQFASDVEVTRVGAPHLATMVEEKIRGKEIEMEALTEEIRPAFVEKNGLLTDTVVLGCTHYPLLLNELKAAAPWSVSWMDPAAAVATQLKRILYPSAHPTPCQIPSATIAVTYTSGVKLPPEIQMRMGEFCGCRILPSF